jgi:4,5-DOPA dioxygenase extradiol
MDRQPAAFLAHGSPLSGLGGDDHAAALQAYGERVTGMKAILIVSAHWQVSRPLRVTAWDHAPLLYDFGGFPDQLYSLTYPAPGDPGVAARVARTLVAEGQPTRFDTERGLDHGAWVPLRLAWPEAKVPVLQLSMPFLEPQELFQMGRALRPLRNDGIVVLGSGGIVHNLRKVRLENKSAPIEDWAAGFDTWVARQIEERNLDALLAYRSAGPYARLAVPTTEHFDPLFIALGSAFADEKIVPIFEGFQYGNLSMRSFAFEA